MGVRSGDVHQIEIHVWERAEKVFEKPMSEFVRYIVLTALKGQEIVLIP